MPAVVGSTAGGASQYSGTFAIVVSAGGATLVYSRIDRAGRVGDRQRRLAPAAGAAR